MFKTWINKLFGKTGNTEVSTSGVKKGTVKFFNRSKRFGFITINDSEEEIFVHASNLKDKVRKSDKVTFEIKEGKKGLTAVNVRRV